MMWRVTESLRICDETPDKCIVPEHLVQIISDIIHLVSIIDQDVSGFKLLEYSRTPFTLKMLSHTMCPFSPLSVDMSSLPSDDMSSLPTDDNSQVDCFSK
eukprot:GHVR01058055.1.p1 GENE.GHVR01058055.1~~GHVR01058055.1.p1  ORF type:complete len:100 (+),score=19.30 GHVR01058055.1:252-551(+)